MTLLNKMHLNQFTFDEEGLGATGKKGEVFAYEIGHVKQSFNNYRDDSSPVIDSEHFPSSTDEDNIQVNN